MGNSFIKSPELLREDSRIEDLLDFSAIMTGFSKKLDSITEPSLIALVGDFGKGKSTMLYNVKQSRQEKEIWVEFDAWKFPERKDLWEGFVLEFARQIDHKTFDQTRKKIEGKEKSDIKSFVDVIGCIPIPGFAAIKNLSHFFETSPARRVFEVQEILSKIIKEHHNDIFIIVEDVDRSGDAGIFFLETLNNFIKSINTDKRVIAISPISTKSFYSNTDSYLKCFDLIEFFNPQTLELYKFVKSIFSEEKEYIGNDLFFKQITSFLENLFLFHSNTTIRLIKLILRKSEINYLNQVDDSYLPDWRTTIAFEASKYYYSDNDNNISFFKKFKDDGVVKGNNIFASFFHAIASNFPGIPKERDNNRPIFPDYEFQIIKRSQSQIENHPSHPYHTNSFTSVRTGNPKACVCDFYLDY